MIEQPPSNRDISSKVFSILNDAHGIKEIKKLNEKYLYWDKVRYQKIADLSPEEIWQTLKLYRSFNYKDVSFNNTHFKYSITDYIQKSLHEFDLHIGGSMGSKSLIPEADKTRYLVSSLMEEAISSSIMEGANTTRRKAKEMLRKESQPKNKGEYMIVNNYLTIKHILKHTDEDITAESILQVHQLMTKNTLDSVENEGKFRKQDDIYVVNTSTNEIVHYPPPFSEIPNYIADLCIFFNKDQSDFIHPIIKGMIIHFMIGWIHPFTDGNGRTARAIFYWYLLKKGYWLMEYLSISRIISDSKNQYEKAYLYTESDNLDVSYFINYHTDVMHKAFDALRNYIQNKQKENLQIANFLKLPNINQRQAQILKTLYDEPEVVFSVKEVQNIFQVSNFSARSDLTGLVNLGYMISIPVNKVQTNYARSENFLELIK